MIFELRSAATYRESLDVRPFVDNQRRKAASRCVDDRAAQSKNRAAESRRNPLSGLLHSVDEDEDQSVIGEDDWTALISPAGLGGPGLAGRVPGAVCVSGAAVLSYSFDSFPALFYC